MTSTPGIYYAAQQIGRESIAATVHIGLRRDAVLFSAGANQTHGLARTNADKHKAVDTLLADAEWRQWNNCEIARRVGVSEHMVRDRRPIFDKVEDAGQRKVERGGTVYVQHTEHIGKRSTETMSGRQCLSVR